MAKAALFLKAWFWKVGRRTDRTPLTPPDQWGFIGMQTKRAQLQVAYHKGNVMTRENVNAEECLSGVRWGLTQLLNDVTKAQCCFFFFLTPLSLRWCQIYPKTGFSTPMVSRWLPTVPSTACLLFHFHQERESQYPQQISESHIDWTGLVHKPIF